MPIYLYRNPATGKIAHIVQGMNEPHVYSEDGVNFERLFTIPNAAIDTNVDTAEKFVQRTGNMKGTLGEIWDYSQELSEKRASQNGGEDPMRKKAEERYSKKRKGMKYKSKISPNEMPKIHLD